MDIFQVKKPENYPFKVHIDSMHNDKRFDCEICGKSFRFYSARHRHTQNVHRGNLSTCPHCGCRLQQYKQLQRHIEEFHR
jgi:predicted SprT family Zn-dependent metalloprotease